jgi:hypothetical protein
VLRLARAAIHNAPELRTHMTQRINGHCTSCGQTMAVPDRPQGGGRTKLYCSPGCRQRSYRERRQLLAPYGGDAGRALDDIIGRWQRNKIEAELRK